MEKKDRKIKSQKHLIKKMKNMVEMQKFQLQTGGCDVFDDDINFKLSNANKSLPTILVEDTNEVKECPKTDEDTKIEARSHSSTLRRQSKFIKGAERPKLFVSPNRQNQPSVSWQDLSSILHKNLSESSCENLLTIPKESVKPAIPSRINVNQKLYNESTSDHDSGVWSVRSCNGELESSKEKFRRRESYQKAVTIDYPSKGRLLARSKHKTIAESNSYDLKRFSSYSHLPNVR